MMARQVGPAFQKPARGQGRIKADKLIGRECAKSIRAMER